MQMGETILHEGYLKKKPEKALVRLWKNRYFLLKNNAQMYYFLTKDAIFHKGTIDLHALETIEIDDTNGAGFNIHLPRRIYYLLANTTSERDEWIKTLSQYQRGKSRTMLKNSTSLIMGSLSSLALKVNHVKGGSAPISYTIKCNAKCLDRKDGPFQKSDPFFVIYTEKTNIPTDIPRSPLLYKSEIIAQHLSPSWEAFILDVDTAGGLDAPIRFECYDYDSDGTTDYIGYFATTLSKFATSDAEFLLSNPRKKTKLNPFYKGSGNVYVTSVIPHFTQAEPATPTYLPTPPEPTPAPSTPSTPFTPATPATTATPSTPAAPSTPATPTTPSTTTPATSPSPSPGTAKAAATPTPALLSVPQEPRNLLKQVSANNGKGRILDLSRSKFISSEDIKATVMADSSIYFDIGITRINASDVKAMDNQLLEWTVTRLPGLTHIDLHWCDTVSGKGIIAIAENCRDLTNASFGCCSKVSASSVTALVSSCTKLKILDLNWVWNVNDETIDVLSKCLTQLEELTLSGCQHLKDPSLYSLANLKSLKVIDLSRCEKLGTEAVLHLASSLPKLETMILLGIDAVTVQWAENVFSKQFPNIVIGFSM